MIREQELICIQRVLAYIQMFREDFTQEILAQDETSRRAGLKQEAESEVGQIADVGRFLELVDKYMKIQQLDAAFVSELVCQIVVHSPERRNGKKHVTIEVCFTYIDEIRIPLQIERDALNQVEPAWREPRRFHSNFPLRLCKIPPGLLLCMRHKKIGRITEV